MNKTQIRVFTTRLKERHTSLREEILQDLKRARDDSYEAVAGKVHDRGDEAIADLVSDLDLFDTSRDVDELVAIEAALTRIQQGAYGVCEDCGDDIPVTRLEANPAASRCLDCQSLRERTYASS